MVFTLRFILWFASCILPLWACAQQQTLAQPFEQWSQEFIEEAKGQGVDETLLQRAFDGLSPNERIIELDRKQPEGTKSFTQYLEDVVTPSRIKKGRELMRKHGALLQKVSMRYEVQPRFIVALWGIETNYGGYTGNFSVIQALATLAYDGRRSEFFRKELLNALKIIDAGHISLSEMDGSWAGAMGQSQFMPSSFVDYAVDFNGDGRKDIWNSLPDVFASIANYLRQKGWNNDRTWGREVRIPEDFNAEWLKGDVYKPLEEWQKLGVRKNNGEPLPDVDIEGALTVPGSVSEGVYLMYRNYDVLLKWNRSRYFATAVGLSSDAIKQ